MRGMNSIYDEIYAFISDLWVIDTHEHTADYKAGPMDYLNQTVSCYARLDLRSAGMPEADLERVCDVSAPVMERWLLCEPYWKACLNTGYIRMHERAAREIYGVQGVNRDTVETLSRLFSEKDHEKSYAEGHRKAKILLSIVDSDMECDRSIQRPAFRMENFVEKMRLDRAGEMLGGVKFNSFCDWLNACEETIRRFAAAGAVAFKSTIATDRSLCIEKASYKEALDAFKNAGIDTPTPAYKAFMFRYVLDIVSKMGLPVQLHTGFSASNNGVISNGNPILLNKLVSEYRDTSFVLMHMGYPYRHELTALAKMFPNVYPDLSWAHIISPCAARTALDEWLDAVPVNKIMGFGGDSRHEDAIRAHLMMAKENIAGALAEKVFRGAFDMEYAKWAAGLLLFENPKRVFKLNDAVIPL